MHVLALLLLAGTVQEPARAKKIVLIAGPLDSHPRDTHEYEKNIILLKHLLDASLPGARTETHFNGWPADPATLDDADTIFLTSGGCDRKIEDHPLYVGDRLAQLEKQMKRGCGFVQFHWSTFNPAKHHDAITEWIGGTFDYETGPAPRKWYSAIETKEWTTAIGSPDHPIARGVQPFKVKEEFYFKIRFRDDDPRLKPILLRQAGGDVRADTVGWAVERKDGGRGFGFTGGHFTANWWLPDFRKLVLNAIAWTAKVEVPPGGVESVLEKPARALILTGHHYPAHHWWATTPALIHALELDPRIKVDVTENLEDLAAKKADGYDLLILNYMNWQKPGLSDTAKENFVRYLDGGGGLVVIHGANGGFNAGLCPKESDWEEFRTKIVRRAWKQPGSGHDDYGPFKVEIAKTKHPITEGLAPFDTEDELYVRLDGDESLESLVTAHSKVTGKQEPLAWAYSYGQGRVFQTTLGHGAVSIRKAAPLIRRGSTWAAKLPLLKYDPPPELTDKPALRPGSPWNPPKQPPAPPPPPKQEEKSKVLPPDPALDGGKGGHWGTTGEKDWADARWNAMDVGPFVTTALAPPGGTATKAVSVRLGEGGAVFDTADLSLRAAWTGGFIQFSPARWGLIEMPRLKGEVQYSTGKGAPWAGSTARYRGLHLHGTRVVFSYVVDDAGVLESHAFEEGAFARTFNLEPCGRERRILLGPEKGRGARVLGGGSITSENGTSVLTIPAHREPLRLKVLLWNGPAPAETKSAPPEDLAPLTKPGPARWGDPIVVKGHVSKEKAPYVVDTLTPPFQNPWKALLFLTGLDFFANGDAAVCTVHGDVWLVRGIDETLENVSWKRFATGLYQPLGLRIVKDRVHVLGRDQVTILHDGNADGEADYYEAFGHARPASAGGHDYVTCLETDAEGNFYSVGPTTLHRTSADGGRVETIATGFRNSNGLAVGPDGTITVAPQEGEWVPASMICEVKPGGHYGYGGPKPGPERPLGYDPPLVYLPRLMDNSGGGQVWVTSERWGPLKGQLLNLSFGRSSMQLILREKVDGVAQGAAVPFLSGFASGLSRGRFRPQDGQLYVCGLKGWVSNAVRDGCLQRVRYTGAPAVLPVESHAEAGGLRLVFSAPLDRELAQDLDRWAAERWNYRHSEKYGSEDYSVAQPNTVGHDPVEIKSAVLSDDGRSVFLAIPDLRPCMQLRVRYSLRAAKGELALTIHRLAARK